MRLFIFAGTCVLAAISAATALADDHTTRQPDDHAPIGVMGDHLHKQGEWMVGYKYRRSTTTGLVGDHGSGKLSNAQSTYGEVPKEMEMNMHMAEVMYGMTDSFTLMAMPQYMTMDMLHTSSHGGGHSHTHEVDGLGDTEVSGLLSIFKNGRANAHLNLGLSLPTGSIDKTFTDHHNNVYNMPYNMQFGSGTFDPIIGATYNNAGENWSWGAQTLNYFRLYDNDNGYHQGNKYTATAWVARNLSEYVSASFRLEGEAWGDVSGRDNTLPLNTIAGGDPDRQAGERVYAYAGLNLLAGRENGSVAGQRLALEFGVPVYERADGPQPDTDYRLTLGWQVAF